MKHIILLLFLTGALNAQNTIRKGFVTRVVDADTYIIQTSYGAEKDTTLRIRLINVDAPEIYSVQHKRAAQPFGDSATVIVSNLILNKEVDLTLYGTDRYNRTLAFVRIHGIRLDDILLRQGLAWASSGYTPKKKYAFGKREEKQAKKEKIGIWSDPNPTPPWIYRKD